jgi:sRNA-binding carbon storage regulator CsrA
MSPSQDGKSSTGVLMDVRVGQSLMIGNVRVTVEKKDGQLARLRVVADRDILIRRPPLEIAANAA